MTNYTKINSVLPLINRAVRNEDSNLTLLSYAFDAYDLLPGSTSKKEEVQIYEVKNHKVQLCQDIETLNLVTHLSKKPSDSECNELNNCVTITSGEAQEEFNISEDNNPCAGNYAIAHKLFLDSNYYNNNYEPMKYIGNSSYVCTSCPNRFCHDCNETFSVDENKILWTSFKDGYICIWYDKRLVDEDGDYLIIDLTEVKKFLALYAELEHFRNRMYSKEQGVQSIVNDLEYKTTLWLKKARGAILKSGLNRNLIAELTTGSYNSRFFRMLPDKYRSKYEQNYNQY